MEANSPAGGCEVWSPGFSRSALRILTRAAELRTTRVDMAGPSAYGAPVLLRGKKLGLLLSTGPAHPNFQHGVRLAETALAMGVDVYLYCIDDAVEGATDSRLRELKARGLKLYACAYGAQRRGIPLSDSATFAGLTIVSDLIASTDRFLSLN